jgi:hypothetical protein
VTDIIDKTRDMKNVDCVVEGEEEQRRRRRARKNVERNQVVLDE